MIESESVRVVVDAQATLGEGPLWDVHQQVLWWVDIVPGHLHRTDPASGEDVVFEIGQMVTTVVTRASGALVLGLERGIGAYDPESGTLEMLCDPESDRRANRFNDGKCDPAGRFWAGTMPIVERTPTASLYCLDTDGRCEPRLSGVTVSNGIVWSADAKTMYYIDTATRRIDAFDFDLATGQIANRRPVVEVSETLGKPDGMAIDADDKLWVGMWGGGRVIRFDPQSGNKLASIDVPSKNVTACAFGGPDLCDLYITTARNGCTEEDLAKHPHSGALFCVSVPVRGTQSFAYRG